MAKILFYDTETTGTMFWKHGIHQLSGIIEIDGVIKEKFNIKMRPNPKALIDDEALKIAGITREDLEKYDLSMEQGYKCFINVVSKYVSKFDKKDKFHLCGFNNRAFDDAFLRALFTQCNDKFFGSWFWSDSLDVIPLASQEFKDERSEMENFKLVTVAKKLGIEVDETKLHDALYDVEITMESYYRLCKI